MPKNPLPLLCYMILKEGEGDLDFLTLDVTLSCCAWKWPNELGRSIPSRSNFFPMILNAQMVHQRNGPFLCETDTNLFLLLLQQMIESLRLFSENHQPTHL